MLHLCVGFYNNGDYKTNTVPDENLQRNIEYNRTFRPGRFYFVDGEYVCGGLLKEPYKSEFIQECKEKLAELNLKSDYCDSTPYWQT